MPRKTAAAAHGALPLSLVPPLPAPANVAPKAADSAVVARKRTRRAKVAPVAAPPTIVKPAIDLTRTDARKALAVAFPLVIGGKVVEADQTHAMAAAAYFEARDAEARADGAKEAAGNVLRYAIGDAEEIHGEGWKATWKYQKSEIDWSKLVKELAIDAATIERFRKPAARVLQVREVVEI